MSWRLGQAPASPVLLAPSLRIGAYPRPTTRSCSSPYSCFLRGVGGTPGRPRASGHRQSACRMNSWTRLFEMESWSAIRRRESPLALSSKTSSKSSRRRSPRWTGRPGRRFGALAAGGPSFGFTRSCSWFTGFLAGCPFRQSGRTGFRSDPNSRADSRSSRRRRIRSVRILQMFRTRRSWPRLPGPA